MALPIIVMLSLARESVKTLYNSVNMIEGCCTYDSGLVLPHLGHLGAHTMMFHQLFL